MRALPSVRQLEPRYTASGEQARPSLPFPGSLPGGYFPRPPSRPLLPGPSQVCLTTDLPSAAGYVLLRHANHSQVEEDCRTIEELQPGLMLVE